MTPEQSATLKAINTLSNIRKEIGDITSLICFNTADVQDLRAVDQKIRGLIEKHWPKQS